LARSLTVLILAFIFFLGLKVLESSSRIARIGAPRQRSSALFWWWRSKRITSSLPRGVNRCVAEKKSTKTAVKSKTDLKKMTPAASSRRGQSWLDINWGEDERPATIETLQNAGRPLPSQSIPTNLSCHQQRRKHLLPILFAHFRLGIGRHIGCFEPITACRAGPCPRCAVTVAKVFLHHRLQILWAVRSTIE
jgi:hypothetical protein